MAPPPPPPRSFDREVRDERRRANRPSVLFVLFFFLLALPTVSSLSDFVFQDEAVAVVVNVPTRIVHVTTFRLSEVEWATEKTGLKKKELPGGTDFTEEHVNSCLVAADHLSTLCRSVVAHEAAHAVAKDVLLCSDTEEEDAFVLRWQRYCLEHAAMAPSSLVLIKQKHKPKLYFSVTQDDDTTTTTTTTTNDYRLYDHKQNTWSTTHSPLHFPVYANHQHWFTVDDSASRILGAGMHRTLVHDFKLSLLNDDHKNAIISGSLLGLLLPFTEDVFLDLDEPSPAEEYFGCRVVNRNATCEVELVPPTTRIIDIEQPSFASPQNMVALELRIVETQGGGAQPPPLLHHEPLHLVFESTLHLRYLTPGTTRVTVPSAVVYAGMLWTTSGKVRYRPPEQATTTDTIPTVAGSDDDYWPVLVTTGLAALLGSVVSMGFLARAGTWD